MVVDSCRFVGERSTYHPPQHSNSPPIYYMSCDSEMVLKTMTYTVEVSAEQRVFTQEIDMEDEEDLFEIDLEAVNHMSAPHYWDSYFTSSTGSALLANCLLPVSDISSAVPIPWAGTTSIFMITEPMSVGLGECLKLPFFGCLFDFQAGE